MGLSVAQKSQAPPIISVIIATRNRRTTLAQFLARAGELPAEPQWELVIVDNGSTDGTAELLASSAGALPLVVLDEPQRGKSRALNKALRHAGGEILLFADDDILPDLNWLPALHRACANHPTANIFGGKILVDYKNLPAWVVDSYNLKTILTSEQNLGNELKWFCTDRYPMGPNLAVRRRVLEENRCEWPVNFGPGTKIPMGDERVFLMQMSRPEARDRLYVPGSIVRHTIVGRDLKIANAAARCFLGGYAAGLIGRHQEQPVRLSCAPVLAWQRYRQSASACELLCSVARAAGVVTGKFSPFPTRVHG
jgi:hypothetical protein